MDDHFAVGLTAQPWFWWAAILVVGVPLVLLGLTELHTALVKRGNALARPVGLLRNYAVPVGALLLLVTQLSTLEADETWVRVVATIFGFLLIVFVLSSLNAAMFLNAEHGTWRQRLPSIFVDLARVVLIGIGLAIVFAQVWGTNVGGLFAALGVGSIIIGFTLQNAVGSVVSGLLLLFEQPFALGDWLDTGSVKGRVVEVNWRSVHIDTGNGVQIVPNASLAGSSFANLSLPTPDYTETVETSFATDDDPGRVCAMLDDVAADMPHLRPGSRPSARPTGAGGYVIGLALATYADAGSARSTFLARIWYASRRAGLHLDGGDPAVGVGAEQVEAALRAIGPSIHLGDDDVAALVPRVGIERFADGEIIQREGVVPDCLRFLIEGRASVGVEVADGELPIGSQESGDYVGQTVLTREPAIVTVRALGEVTVLRVPPGVVDELLKTKPGLVREIGEEIESRRRLVREALSGGGAKIAR